jgi:hypothetical protein
MNILYEMPHISVDTDCPNCGNSISLMDYCVELWDGLTNIEKEKWVNRLYRGAFKHKLEVICLYCDTYFIYNSNTKQSIIKKVPIEIMNNKKYIIQVSSNYKNNSILNFETFYKAYNNEK